MYTVEQYIRDTKLLTNSLVIKINEIPMVLNTAVTIEAENRGEPHMVPTMLTKRTWKYYLNLAGKMHPYDTPVKIRVIETDNEEVLTAELLERYPLTGAKLRENGAMYEQLMLAYPEHIRYIHGCLYPVDIDTAIEAKEGTILAYNKRYIEENEYYLIRDIETFIRNILARWHVKPYTIVDELYLPSLLAFLYAVIYLKIFNIRLSKIYTFQVHSFHLEHFYRSHMDLWDDVKILNKPSIYWLYKNLEVMLHNVGKMHTFEKIYNKLFHMNGIGLGEYKASRMDPKYVTNMYNIQEASFTRQEVTLVTNKLNEDYLTNNGMVTSVESMIRNELDLLLDVNKNIPSNFKRYFMEVGVTTSERILRETEKTKILDIDMIKTLKKTGLDLYAFIMDYWVYAIHMDKLYKDAIEYTGNVYTTNKKIRSFTNEEIEIKTSENKIYKATPMIGLLMLIKLMLFSSGELDKKLSKIKFFRIMDHNKDKMQEIIDTKIIQDGLSHALLLAFKDEMVEEPAYFPNINSFQDFLRKNVDLAKAIWVFMANSQNFLTTSNIKLAFKLLAKDGYLNLSEDGNAYTIDELLAQHGITYNIDTNTDMLRTMSKLVETFTGIKLDLEDELVHNLNKYRTILKKLTSYSLQALGAEGIEKEIVAYYNNPTMLKTEKGFVMTYGLEVRGLEPVYAKLIANSNDYPDGIYVNKVNYRPFLAIDGPLTGDLILKNTMLRKYGYPTEFHADFISVPHYYWEHHKWFVNWITVHQLEVQGLEPNTKELKGNSNKTPRNRIDYNLIKDKGVIKTLKEIKGDLVIQEGPWLSRSDVFSLSDMPLCWYKPTLVQILEYSGLTIGTTRVPLEHSNPIPTDDINTVLSPNATIYNLSSFANKKYDSIGLLAFRLYRNDGTITHNESFITYIDNEIIQPTPSFKKSSRLHNGIETVSIDKATAIGLAMLPYRLNLSTTHNLGLKAKLEYIGLLDGTRLDIYDMSNIELVNDVYLQELPILQVSKFNLSDVLSGKLVISNTTVSDMQARFKYVISNITESMSEEDREEYKNRLRDLANDIDPNLLDVIANYDIDKYPFLKDIKIRP